MHRTPPHYPTRKPTPVTRHPETRHTSPKEHIKKAHTWMDEFDQQLDLLVKLAEHEDIGEILDKYI